jgi:GNAT superfamily N-acetyltransferase
MTAWREMRQSDLAAVLATAAVVHPGYPEDAAVFAERLALHAAGCRVLADAADRVLGYTLTHPWCYGAPPKLNTLLRAIPADADTYYLHDIAILPAARGAGAATALLALLAEHAAALGLTRMSLVAVNASRPIWEKRGFVVAADARPDLASYGGEAWFMARGYTKPR